MFIQTEATPDSVFLKVLPGRAVPAESTFEASILRPPVGLTQPGLDGHSGCLKGSQDREDIPPWRPSPSETSMA